jgi:hypothetical protein
MGPLLRVVPEGTVPPDLAILILPNPDRAVPSEKGFAFPAGNGKFNQS